MHHNETGRIPYLIGKVTACLHTLPVETHIITRCISCDKRETKGICTILINHLQWIDTIAEGFTHLTSLTVSYQSVDQYRIKWNLSGVLQSGEHHTDDPEENNIISGYKSAGWIEIIHLFRIVRPAKSTERPQRRREPGIQRIRILTHRLPAFWTIAAAFLCYNHLSAVITVKCRNLMTPPELTGNTPVVDIVQPVLINLAETVRDEVYFPVLLAAFAISSIFTNHCGLIIGSTVVLHLSWVPTL